ncbi:MAG: hypothetical protein EXX96DRAFT_164432 [Benjaminiella poitrasii]|nr:MAG: hypothetical protein EXX96DRAFT_164432 [Benjaminiella poitrasii]
MLPVGQNEGVIDQDDSDEETKPSKRNGRRKIKIEYIEDKNKRHITFSKRKAGIMKKAYELSTLTGTQVLLLVVSETGLVYTFTTTKLQPIVTKPEGKNLIQTCLNTPDPTVSEEMPSDTKLNEEEEEGEDEQEVTATAVAEESHNGYESNNSNATNTPIMNRIPEDTKSVSIYKRPITFEMAHSFFFNSNYHLKQLHLIVL